MKKFSPTGAKLIQGLRVAFGAGDFSAKTVLERSELLPLVHTLVGRRGQVIKRLAHWFREHKDSVTEQMKLTGERSTHRRRWVWCVESEADGLTAEELMQTIEDTGERMQSQIEAKRSPLAQIEAGERVRVKLEKNATKAEEAAERFEAKEREREERQEQRKALKAAERAAEPWGVLIKGRSRFMPRVIALIKEPYAPQLIEGQHIVQCSRERAGEIAARLHQLVRTVPHANAIAIAVRIGETPAQKQQRHDAAKTARLTARRNRPGGVPLDAGCDTEQRALLAAIGAGTIPFAPLGRPIRCPGWEAFHKL